MGRIHGNFKLGPSDYKYFKYMVKFVYLFLKLGKRKVSFLNLYTKVKCEEYTLMHNLNQFSVSELSILPV